MTKIVIMQSLGGKALQAEGTASAKAVSGNVCTNSIRKACVADA